MATIIKEHSAILDGNEYAGNNSDKKTQLLNEVVWEKGKIKMSELLSNVVDENVKEALAQELKTAMKAYHKK
jgi:RecJ-like exonuclease